MITKLITERHLQPGDAGLKPVRELYESAFPVEEQIPWDDLMRLTVTMPLDFTIYYMDGTMVGLTIVYPRRSFNWFWYFAVPAHLRGRGIGQAILTRLIDRYKSSTNVLDMESPQQACDNAEQRRRRHAFYLRNGFRDTGVGRSFGGIDYTIMIMGEGTFTTDDYDDIIAELRAKWDAMPSGDTP